MAKEPWKGKRDELLLISAALDRELDDFTKRDTAMQGRATVLVGAASVVGAIQLGDAMMPLTIVNLVLSFAAALFGVLVLFPRTGSAFNPRGMQEQMYAGMREDEALHNMIRVKLESLEEDEKSLKRGGWFAKLGFILLTAGILAAAIGAFVPPQSSEIAPTPTPTEVTDHG